jgi:dolichol-phosphate mannosyltransferase
VPERATGAPYEAGVASTEGRALRRSLCVLVPAFNEVDNIEPTVAVLLKALSETCDEYEVIVVDDGSTDGTGRVADQLAAENPSIRVIHEKRNKGIGHAYMRGYKETRCTHFVYIPGDNTWPHASCRRLFDQLGRADVVTSYALNSTVRTPARRVLSTLYTSTLNFLFGHDMRYYNGLNIYPVWFLRQRPSVSSSFGFQAEVLLEALAAGLSYTEISLEIDERASGGSKAVRLKNIAGVIGTLLRLVWRLKFKPTSARPLRR